MKFIRYISITADAVKGSWVYRIAPTRMQPYLKLARIDRPVGIWLLLWPCFWSVTLGSQGLPSLTLLLLFAVGALVMRGAGCTYNDIVDRDFDRQVLRTRSRPIPAGEVTVFSAWVFLAAQLLVGLLILLSLQLFYSDFSLYLGLGALALVAVYPFMKRITYWPQAWLGLTFNWGVLMGFVAAGGELGWLAFLLYFGTVFWTLGYDTIYAHQDKEDDAFIGVKSTAIKLGNKTKFVVSVFYGLFISALFGTGWLANLGVIYYIGTGLACLHLVNQIRRLDIDNPDICLNTFRSNIRFGWILFLALVADKVI